MREASVKTAIAFLAGVAGLALLLWGSERGTLVAAAAERAHIEAKIPGGVLVTLMIGVSILSIAVFSALSVLSRYIRTHPSARQAPVWVLVLIMVAAGGLGLSAYAIHSSNLNSLAVLPSSPDAGFVAGQVLAASIVISVLVALGVRWTPRRRPARTRR